MELIPDRPQGRGIGGIMAQRINKDNFEEKV